METCEALFLSGETLILFSFLFMNNVFKRSVVLVRGMAKQFVRDVMNRKVITVPEDASVKEVSRLMSRKHISCIIVTSKRGKPVGLITERDLIKRVLAKEKKPSALKAADIMTPKLLTLTPDTTIVQAAKMMKEHGIRRFPIMEKNILLGIVTETDILEGLTDVIRHLNWKLVNVRMALEDFMQQLEGLLQ